MPCAKLEVDDGMQDAALASELCPYPACQSTRTLQTRQLCAQAEPPAWLPSCAFLDSGQSHFQAFALWDQRAGDGGGGGPLWDDTGEGRPRASLVPA